MGFYDGPVIVNSGLVLSLDAADRNSYPGSGTAWSDLSGNNNTGTLTNGPTFNSANGGAIVFDGTNDYVNFSNILNFERTNPFSISFWIKSGTPAGTFSVINKLSWVVGAKGWRVVVVAGNTFLTFQLTDNHTINDISLQLNNVLDNTWHNVCFTYDGNGVTNGMSGYLDSNLIVTGGGGNLSTTTTSSTVLQIFGVSATGVYGAGSLANTLVHNRVLSATEILQNYNAQKSRFGL